MSVYGNVFGLAVLTLASAGDVRSGIDRGDGVLGTLTLPTIGDVRSGIRYGAGGSEFTGTLTTSFVASDTGSEFEDLLTEGGLEMLAQTGRTLSFAGKSANVIPGEAMVSAELRDAGLWEQGSMVVELLRTDFLRLFRSVENADRKQATLAGKPMQVFVIGDDPSDPWVRLHLKPPH